MVAAGLRCAQPMRLRSTSSLRLVLLAHAAPPAPHDCLWSLRGSASLRSSLMLRLRLRMTAYGRCGAPLRSADASPLDKLASPCAPRSWLFLAEDVGAAEGAAAGSHQCHFGVG